MPLTPAHTAAQVTRTLDEIHEWRPVLDPVLHAFAPLLRARADLAAPMAAALEEAGLALPALNPERLGQGVPLLADATFAGSAAPLRLAAATLLPHMRELKGVDAALPALEILLLAEDAAHSAAQEALVRAVAADDHAALARLAEENGVEAPALEFVGQFVAGAVLRGLAAQAAPEGAAAPWDAGGLWREGCCPVCGALPTLGWLDKPAVDEKNAYLVGGGGKKHLHCGLCGANWPFRRGACPACGAEGNDVMELLRESGPAHGERLDWCTKCKGYCPTVDLRERDTVPDPDALALGMLHLDMVASRKKLHPLRPSFWNTF